MSKGNVLIQLSGSISCFKACTLPRCWSRKAIPCRPWPPKPPSDLWQGLSGGITGRAVLTDLFGGVPDYTPHITLAQRWADLLLAYPASANLLNRLAAGCARIYSARSARQQFHKPLWLAPAMNCEMFAHPAVQASIMKLEFWGAVVLPTEEGRLACGSIGKGRLLAPELVMDRIKEAL